MLEVQGLEAGYGRVPILRNINLVAPAGQLTLVLGPNGAGKSTLLRTLAGLNRPTAGSVKANGREITGLAPERMVANGLRLVLDGHRVFPRLSVRENIRLGVRGDASDLETRLKDVYEVFPILHEKLDDAASSLSGGQQQMLALAQAFVARPDILLVDEPSLGIAEMLIPTILAFLKRWASLGTAVLLVEQRIDIALKYADGVYVLRGGEIVLSGDSATLSEGGAIERLYLGD
ncbi:ABC transporter ATP-binding protein [Chelativorans sp. J32]|uniref:ABC transporter ATP-binding protein n=1 Tax=Chelativorans sp. J32 TaxID=935840 RepID=UPI00047F9008|nr:ABC transporter ATP-binding protein [Chelativorans sp. J32]